MNKIYPTILVALIFLSGTICCTDKRTEFKIYTYNLSDSSESKRFNDWKIQNSIVAISDTDCRSQSQILWDSISRIECFYQDEQYRVFGTNLGEWGGTIVFEDKSSEFSYMMSCSDLVMVNYQDSTYYITDAVPGSDYGHTRILKIRDPRDLIKIQTKNLSRNQHSRDSILAANATFLKDLKKEITLLDTSNLTASIFYPYKGHDYLVYSAKHPEWRQFDEVDTTYLGEIVDNKLEAIDMILPFPTLTTQFKANHVVNGIYSYSYDSKHWRGTNVRNETVLFIDSNGGIYMKGDTIIIGYRHYDERRVR